MDSKNIILKAITNIPFDKINEESFKDIVQKINTRFVEPTKVLIKHVKEEFGLTGWQIFGIVIGSVIGLCIVVIVGNIIYFKFRKNETLDLESDENLNLSRQFANNNNINNNNRNLNNNNNRDLNNNSNRELKNNNLSNNTSLTASNSVRCGFGLNVDGYYHCASSDCPYKARSMQQIRDHYSHHKATTNYKCQFCNFYAKKPEGLVSHEMMHRNAKKKIQKEEEESKNESHLKSNSNSDPFQTSFGFGFDSASAFTHC